MVNEEKRAFRAFECTVVGVNYVEGKAAEGDVQDYEIRLQPAEHEDFFAVPWTELRIHAFGEAQAAPYNLGSCVKVTIEPSVSDMLLAKRDLFAKAEEALAEEEDGFSMTTSRVLKAIAEINRADPKAGAVLASAYHLADAVR